MHITPRHHRCRWAGLAAAVVTLIIAAGCEPAHIPSRARLPLRDTLPVVARIIGHPSFLPTGIASTRTCDVILVGGRWGTIVRLHPDGQHVAAQGQIPGYRQSARLESVGDSVILVWSHMTEFVGVVDPIRLAIDSLPVPVHAWGNRWLGPVAGLAGRGYVVAPLGDAAIPRRSPEAWVSTPALYINRTDKGVAATAGTVGARGGAYLSWLAAVATVGTDHDTVRVLSHADASIRTYAPVGNGKGYVQAATAVLPTYIEAPAPSERVRRFDWIQVDGERVELTHVPQVETATFGPEGKLFAVRPYAARWDDQRTYLFGAGGRWTVTDRALEIYDRAGNRLGAYALPGVIPRWIRADSHGRVFIGDGTDTVRVAQDPTRPPSDCTSLASTIHISALDTAATIARRPTRHISGGVN